MSVRSHRTRTVITASFFDCIQSLDREALVTELEKNTGNAVRGSGKPLPVLLELHSGEESKSGFQGFDELFRAAEMIVRSPGLRPLGLMTMAPFTADNEIVRRSFTDKIYKLHFPLRSPVFFHPISTASVNFSARNPLATHKKLILSPKSV